MLLAMANGTGELTGSTLRSPRGAPARAGFVACMASAAPSYPADDGRMEVARDLGAIRAWRLGPEAVEERCREPDPDGIEARRKALQAWLDKNSALIKSVDERAAEVVPLAYPVAANVDAVMVVRAQVKSMLLEEITTGKTPDQLTAICKAEANPASPRWNSNGIPHVPQSLAALYDWQAGRGLK